MVIPDSVTSIGKFAFQNCSAVTELSIGIGVTTIEEGTFYGCSALAELVIPAHVTTVYESAFSNCTDLQSLTLPGSLTTVGSGLFYGCDRLTDVYAKDLDWWFDFCREFPGSIPLTVNGNSKNLYLGGEKLTQVAIPEGHTDVPYAAFSHCSITEVTIPQTLTTISACAFQYCTELRRIEIGSNVTKIDVYAFRGCTGLESVALSEGIVEIGGCAFQGCTGLESVTLPDSVTTLGAGVLRDCTGLKTAVLPALLGTTGANTFYGCSQLTDVRLPENIIEIGSYAFYECVSLGEDMIPDSVQRIGEYAFHGCTAPAQITVPSTVSFIGEYAFYGCTGLVYNMFEGAQYLGDEENPYVILVRAGDDTCVIHEDTKFIGSGSFGRSSASRIVIPRKVVSIGANAFRNSQLQTVAMHNGIKRIGTGAFADCWKLESVVIPASVSNIGQNAFDACYALVDVYYGGTFDQWPGDSGPMDDIFIAPGNEYLTGANVKYNYAHCYYGHICAHCGHVDAQPWEVVQLYCDITVDTELMVPADVLIDLNGHTLTTPGVASFGFIFDSGDGDGALVTQTYVQEDHTYGDSYLPIHDSTGGCYRFYAYTLDSLGTKEQGSLVIFGVALRFENPEAYSLLATSEDSGVDLSISLDCGGNAVGSFAFGPELIRNYAALQVKCPEAQAALLLKVTGVETLTAQVSVTAVPTVTALGGAQQKTGDSIRYNFWE